ncbi:MAG: hypothetical protein C0425_04505 [Chlorobiaceae bacterium]|nr:hypothetical protein [Chlorobiaceae bacterium]
MFLPVIIILFTKGFGLGFLNMGTQLLNTDLTTLRSSCQSHVILFSKNLLSDRLNYRGNDFMQNLFKNTVMINGKRKNWNDIQQLHAVYHS